MNQLEKLLSQVSDGALPEIRFPVSYDDKTGYIWMNDGDALCDDVFEAPVGQLLVLLLNNAATFARLHKAALPIADFDWTDEEPDGLELRAAVQVLNKVLGEPTESMDPA